MLCLLGITLIPYAKQYLCIVVIKNLEYNILNPYKQQSRCTLAEIYIKNLAFQCLSGYCLYWGLNLAFFLSLVKFCSPFKSVAGCVCLCWFACKYGCCVCLCWFV